MAWYSVCKAFSAKTKVIIIKPLNFQCTTLQNTQEDKS
jgi:hypothetical protein